MSLFKILITFFLLSLLSTGYVSAQTYGTQDGPRTTSSVISIDLTVQKPGTTTFVENLGAGDPKYKPGDTVPFRAVITNTGTSPLSPVRVTDNFPQFMSNAADNTDNAIATISTLAPRASQTVTFSGKIADANNLPKDQRVFCLVNEAVATAGEQSSSDTTQVCIENPTVSEQVTTKGGLPVYQPESVQTVPTTGPEMLALVGLVPGGFLGYYLRKKTD